jgi:AcrR family transcriptional regulator
MRVSSHLSNAARRAPQQDRSTRRVAAFLEAGDTLFAELGFEGATMTAIADRAGSSIGALYSYFPDKKALAMALLDIYAAKIEQHWKPLFDEVKGLSAKEFSEGFLDGFLNFITANPGYLQLQVAPIRLRRTAAAKRAFRATLIDALRRRLPLLTIDSAQLRAGVMLQIVRGMMQMYAEADSAQKAIVVEEFKTALTAYVTTVFFA